MDLNKLFVCLFMFISLISMASALTINPQNISVNKTFNQNVEVDLQIINNNNFDMFNITFEEDFINFPNLDLQSNEGANITAIITRNSDFNGDLTLRGDFETQIGQSNITETVNLDYPDGFDICNVNLVEGDSVKWVNQYSDSLKLINADTNVELHTIPANSEITQKYSNPVSFNYYATWVGIKFTETCSIEVNPGEGFVHDSQYDTKLNLDLKINFDPTTISANTPKTNYNITYNEDKSDILTIENTGSKTAKQIHLEAEWFTFDKNDFDLDSGDSINVGYTIKPEVFETNQTNKTHIKTLKITGNFDTINRDFNIFVPFQNIKIFQGSGADEEVIQNFVKFYCADNPDNCEQIICSITPDRCVDGRIQDNSSVTQKFSEDTINELLQKVFEINQQKEEQNKIDSEIEQNQTQFLRSLENKTEQNSQEAKSINEKFDDFITLGMFAIFLFLFIVVVLIILFIWRDNGAKDFLRRKLKYHKGEF